MARRRARGRAREGNTLALLLIAGGIGLWLLGQRPTEKKLGPTSPTAKPPFPSEEGVQYKLSFSKGPALFGQGIGQTFGKTVPPNTTHYLDIGVVNGSLGPSGAPAPVTVTVTFYVYEGSALAAHGTLLQTMVMGPHTLDAGSTTAIGSEFFNTVLGSIDRRDVGVVVRSAVTNAVLAQDEWDDVFYVQSQAVEAASFSGPPVLF